MGEIGNCIGQDFIRDEIDIIRPKLLLLMGSVSKEAFYEHFLGRFSVNTLVEDIKTIVRKDELLIAETSGLEINILPIPHASARDGSFQRMVGNRRLVNIIRRTLGIEAES